MRDRNFSICHSIAARNKSTNPLAAAIFSGEISAFPVLLIFTLRHFPEGAKE